MKSMIERWLISQAEEMQDFKEAATKAGAEACFKCVIDGIVFMLAILLTSPLLVLFAFTYPITDTYVCDWMHNRISDCMKMVRKSMQEKRGGNRIDAAYSVRNSKPESVY